MGGHGIAGTGLSIAISPRAGRSSYLAVFGASGGLAFAAAALVAGQLAGMLPSHFDVAGHALTNIHVLFVLSGIGRASAALLCTRVQDAGVRGGGGDVVRAFGQGLPRGFLGRSSATA